MISAVLLCGCPKPPPPPPEVQAPPPPVVVPAGCLDDLSGQWAHQDAPFQYDAIDDGGTLTLLVSRPFVPDGGPRWRQFVKPRLISADGGASESAAARGPVDAGAPRAPVAVVTLQRTPGGFVGEAVAKLPHPIGRTCEAHWKTEVLSCLDGGLTLRSQSEVALSDVCQPPVNPQPTLSLDHRLLRVAPGR